MSRITSLLARPAVRAVLAQRRPRLDISDLFSKRRWLVVELSPGRLGEPGARLIGAVVTYAVWAAVEARAALPPNERRFVGLYFDELQTLSALPFGLEHLFERARGLGAGVTIATQALGRLPKSLRQALLGNVGTLISFRVGHDEATRLARELPGLTAQDLQGLRRFDVAARISLGIGSGVTTVTGHTEPLPARTGQAARIRALSAERYGSRPAEANDAAASPADAEPELGRSRRTMS